jgi:hypothetical protein
MKNATIRIGLTVAVLGLVVGASRPASAELITFEDAVPENGAFVPQGYKGFQWTGGFGDFSWVLATPTDGQDIFSPHSGTNYIWSNGGTSLTLSDGTFDFNSMWVKTGGGTGTDTAHGFLNGTEIFTQQFAVGTTYSLVTLNFTGIDTITFDTTPFNLVADDITVNNLSITTPEPSTLATASIAGLLGLGITRRHRKVMPAAS